ncbi:hypothetical protein NUW58_g9660 [Xylaria curta]|uniref:Uncharacterized protein n=1 Tax=Xylaria curta TaxID=42375 RepID=A0ACC1MV79_9PEZI|nr:hypothetical protein NUW58_g9660 [Xylaria curta]
MQQAYFRRISSTPILVPRSKLLQKVILELLIRAIARPMLELITMNLKAERLRLGLCFRRRDVHAKHSALLRQRLDLIPHRHDLEGEPRVLDHDAAHADAAGAPAARHLDLGAVQVRRAQLRRRPGAAVV